MNRTLFEYHPEIGYKFIPNLKVRINHESGGYFVKTNNLGFRSDSDYFFKKSKKRVLVFGDSFTAGDGVSNKYRYTDVLNQENEDIEFYNFGLPGSGTDQQFILYKEYAPQFEHDLLIISVLVENIRRVNAHYRYYLDSVGSVKVWQKPYFQLENDQLVLHNVPVNPQPVEVDSLDEENKQRIDTGGRFEKIRKLVIKLGLKESIQKLTGYQPVPEYNSANSKQWKLLKAILTNWISLSKVPVIIVPIPLYQHIEETSSTKSYQKRFQELKDKAIICDPLSDLIQYDLPTRRKFRFEKDVHLTASGHKAIADSLIKTIKNHI